MEGLYIIIPIAITFFALAVTVFFWASRSGQFEDLEGEAHRILMDDETIIDPNKTEPNK